MVINNKELSARVEVNREHPILLIGGKGLVGQGLEKKLRSQFGDEAVLSGSLSKDNPEVELDITDLNSVQQAIDKTRPGLIYHLAAATNVNLCETNPQLAEDLNVLGTRNVLEAAGDIPVFYFSTDFVFDGKSPTPVSEEVFPHPESVYGRTKYEGELAFWDSGNPGAIWRISYPWYSVSEHLANPALKDSMWWMLQALLTGKDVPAFENVIGNWTPMQELQDKLFSATRTCLFNDLKILHLSGATPTTPYEVATYIKRLLEDKGIKDLGEVVPVQFVADPGKTAPRPARGGLDTSLSRSLGLGMTSVKQAIEDGLWLKDEDLEKILENSHI